MAESEIKAFLDAWKDNDSRIREAFVSFKEGVEKKEGVTLAFKARPGVSYSLRAAHGAQTGRELFVMIDVVDDDPDARWISMCFYGDMVTDPEEKGDLVPGGLLGEDGYCFDLDEWDDDDVAYLAARLNEAADAASRG